MPESALTDRWTRLRPHVEQQRLRRSTARFKIVSAGRRSGKTELAKRRLVLGAMSEARAGGEQFLAAAPTLSQAKQIFWRDLLALTPEWFVSKINRTDLTIELSNGALLGVRSLDRPERIEGGMIRGIVIDEIANCPEAAWREHVRPALSTEGCIGWAWLIGVPEGRNFYYRLAKKGQARQDGHEHFTWFSSDILPPEEIAAAKSELDTLTYSQEYEGSFVTFEGRAYYDFGRENLRRDLKYDPKLDLIFCFDFNVSPGVAAVLQERDDGTHCVGEVWIPQNSNTPAVCAKLIKDWGKEGRNHQGRIKCYGDAAGGARGTAKIAGTDWELIEKDLKHGFPGTVNVAGMTLHRVSMNVPGQNPSQRARVNAMNSRIKSTDGTKRFFVDPSNAPHIAEDFEGVRLLKGGSGEIDKKSDPMLTHLSDGIGYYVEREHPVRAGKTGGVIRHG